MLASALRVFARMLVLSWVATVATARQDGATGSSLVAPTICCGAPGTFREEQPSPQPHFQDITAVKGWRGDGGEARGTQQAERLPEPQVEADDARARHRALAGSTAASPSPAVSVLTQCGSTGGFNACNPGEIIRSPFSFGGDRLLFSSVVTYFPLQATAAATADGVDKPLRTARRQIASCCLGTAGQATRPHPRSFTRGHRLSRHPFPPPSGPHPRLQCTQVQSAPAAGMVCVRRRTLPQAKPVATAPWTVGPAKSWPTSMAASKC